MYINTAITERRKTWIAALRSGKYKQGRGLLRPSEDTYCCLGVACKCQGIEVDEEIPGYDGYTIESGTDYENRTFALNLGLNPFLIQELVEMNDIEEASFDEIADFLEREWGYV